LTQKSRYTAFDLKEMLIFLQIGLFTYIGLSGADSELQFEGKNYVMDVWGSRGKALDQRAG